MFFFLIGCKGIEMMFKLKECNNEKAFMLAILKMKEYASMSYEILKKNQAREAKYDIRAWSKLKKHMDKRILPSLYKQ